MKRGEIRWYTFRLPDERRPVLILARDDVANAPNEVIVVPVTRTVRGLATEVILTPSDGMPTTCALNFDHTSLAQHDRIGAVLSMLPDERWPDVERALLLHAVSAQNELANSELQQTWASLRSAHAAELCYVGRTQRTLGIREHPRHRARRH